MSARVRLQRLAVVVCVAAGACVVQAAPAYAASVTHSYLQFNMCGNVCNDASLNVANDTISSVNARSPQPFVVTLNEVCRNQYNHLDNSLAAYSGRFEVTVVNGCGGGIDYGIAILVRTASFTVVGAWALPNPGGNEARKLVCLQTSATGGGTQPLVACVTHIDYHSANYGPQIQAVSDIVEPLWSGNHVMVGGDFNVTPGSSSLNPMYSSNYSPAGNGVFNEADTPTTLNRSTRTSTTNESTNALNKIDFIFLSKFDFTNYTGDATFAANSDHDPLWATVTYV